MNITVKTEIKKKSDRTTAVCKNGGFSAFLETKVLVESSVIFSNFGAEIPPLLQAAKRYQQEFAKNYADKYRLKNCRILVYFFLFIWKV